MPIGQIRKPNTSTMINRNTGAKPKITSMAVFVWSEKMSRYVLSVERIRAFCIVTVTGPSVDFFENF